MMIVSLLPHHIVELIHHAAGGKLAPVLEEEEVVATLEVPSSGGEISEDVPAARPQLREPSQAAKVTGEVRGPATRKRKREEEPAQESEVRPASVQVCSVLSR